MLFQNYQFTMTFFTVGLWVRPQQTVSRVDFFLPKEVRNAQIIVEAVGKSQKVLSGEPVLQGTHAAVPIFISARDKVPTVSIQTLLC